MSLNLSTLRARLANVLDHDPELQRYKNEVDDLINDAYLQVWNARRWTFTEKQVPVAVRPDLNYARQAVTLTVNDMGRHVVFNNPVYELDPYAEWFTGQVIELAGQDYEIVKVVSTTVLRIDRPYRGSDLSGYTAWKIKQRWCYLPADLVDVLELSDRDAPYVTNRQRNGVIPILDATRETWLNAEQDRTGNRAEYAVFGSPVNVPSGEASSASTDTDANANLPDSTTYELAWCFESPGGVWGPLSDPVEITTGSGGGNNNRVTINTLSHNGDAIAAPAFAAATDTHRNPWEGYRKVVFVNTNYVNGARLGRPRWVLVTYATGAIVSQLDHRPAFIDDEASSLTIHRTAQLNPGNPLYTVQDGHNRRLRLYPRIDNWSAAITYSAGSPASYAEYQRYLQLRYKFAPPYLTASTDTPLLPGHLHAVIWQTAMVALCWKHDLAGRAAFYERQISPLMDQLERDYLVQADNTPRLGQWDGGAAVPLWNISTLEKLT